MGFSFNASLLHSLQVLAVDGETAEEPVKASAGDGKEEQGQSKGRSLGDDAMAAVAALQVVP